MNASRLAHIDSAIVGHDFWQIHGGFSAVEYWRRLYLDGKIDLAEFEKRLGPAIERDDEQAMRVDPVPDWHDPGKPEWR